MKFSIHAFAVMGVIFCSGYSWAAIQGKYYIISGDQRSIDVLQGNGVVQSWAADNRGEYPIAVLDGTVRTSESFFLRCGVYDRRHPGVIQQFYDGTTGGTHNYGYDYSAGRMYQMDLGRQNPVTLFAGPSFNLGVTYDPSNNSLWVSSWSGTQIANFDMSGNLLSSFTTGVSSVTGLALDHTDGTLWFGTQSNLSSSNRTFYQFWGSCWARNLWLACRGLTT